MHNVFDYQSGDHIGTVGDREFRAYEKEVARLPLSQRGAGAVDGDGYGFPGKQIYIEAKEIMSKSALHEQKKLAGLAPRYDWTLSEQVVDTPPDDEPAPEVDGEPEVSPDDDLADTAPEEEKGPKGALQHWEAYRKMESKALKFAQDTMEMYDELSELTEIELTREQRRSLKTAKLAVREAASAQKAAFRKISEFGSTMLGS